MSLFQNKKVKTKIGSRLDLTCWYSWPMLALEETYPPEYCPLPSCFIHSTTEPSQHYLQKMSHGHP